MSPPADQSANDTARQCLKHLTAERQLLEQTLRTLQRVREALLLSDGEKLAAALTGQQENVESAEAMRRQREALRPRLAETLGVPPEAATIGALSDQVSEPWSSELRAARQETAKLSRAVAELARGNALMIRTQSQIVHEVLASLTGGESSEPRYKASGKLESPRTESLFEARF